MTRQIQPKCYESIVKDWLDHAIYGTDKRYNGKGNHGERVFSTGASIYSYGLHFEMARVIYKGKGRTREPAFILVNGERASNTTTKHQGILRTGIIRHMSQLPSVIIPFGALEAAGIDLNSVRIIDTLNDRSIPIHNESSRPPRSYRYADNETVYRIVDWTDEERMRYKHWMGAKDWQQKLDNLLERVRRLNRRIDDGDELNKWEKPLHEQLEALLTAIARHHESGVQPYGSTYVALDPKLEPTGDVITGWVNEHSGGRTVTGYHDGIKVRGARDTATVEHPDDDGVWRWTTYRHILGESLIEADVRATRRVACKQCSGTGWDTSGKMPSLPSGMRWTGYRDQPDWDELMVRDDIMVPVPRTDVDVYLYPALSEPSRTALIEREYRQGRMWRTWTTPVMGALPLQRDAYDCRACSGTGRVQERIMRRNVKFLSGFDHGEPHLAYFFCEMPRCDASTVDEAYEALKPDAVKLAEGMGREVKRQGDIFAIPVTSTTAELKRGAKRYGRRNGKTDAPDTWRNSMLLGTNHQGTEVIHHKDGTIYARGCLWHVPDGRTNDHVRVKLGKQWHIVLKNMVPIRKTR